MYFVIYKDAAGQWRWHLKALNRETIAHGESYITKQSCLHAIELIKGTNADTPIIEKRICGLSRRQALSPCRGKMEVLPTIPTERHYCPE